MPPWRDWTRNGLLHRRMLVRIEPGALSDEDFVPTCIGGLTERKGARLLSDGRGQPRQRSIRCPSALEGMPRWLGHPVSKTVTRLCRGGSTPLPSAQLTARSSSGRTAAPQAADAGSSPARVTIGRRRAPRSVLQAHGLRWTTHKESRHALPPEHDVIQCAPLRSSSAAERVAVNHRRRGFDALLRSPGTVTEDSGTRLQPGTRW